MDFPITSADHRALLRGNAVTPYYVRDGRPPTTPDCCADQANFWGQTLLVTSCALAIYYMPSGRNQNIPHALLFNHPSQCSFQLLVPLSLRGFVDMFFQCQINAIFPRFIHHVNPLWDISPWRLILGVSLDHILHTSYVQIVTFCWSAVGLGSVFAV
jgi:hypothetical protein